MNPFTDSDSAIGIGNSADPASEPGNEPHAPARGRPREATGPIADLLARFGNGEWLRSLVEPPEIWSEARPSVEQLWWYAWRGKSAPESGPARFLVMAWGVVGCVVNAALYLAVWVIALPCYVGRPVPHLDVVTVTRPAAADIWHTGWVTHSHRLIKGYTLAVIPAVLALYGAGWVFARFARSFAAGLAYVVFAHVIGLPWPSWLP